MTLFSLIFIAFVANGQNVCRWSDESTGLTLDLTSIYGELLNYNTQGSDGNSYTYVYNVCENGITCANQGIPSVTGSIVQYNQYDQCYVPGVYNEAVVPSYVVADEGNYWSFYYLGALISVDQCNERTQTINWFCDPNANDPIITSEEETSICQYVMNITYAAACSSIPTDDCIYNDPITNDTLDLSGYEGNTFSADASNGNIFSYSPCNNTLSCPYIDNGMVNIQEIGACYMTALYDYTVQPVRSEDANGDNMYSFYYDNGIGDETCENGRSTVINWHCERLNLFPNMEGKQINQCQYQVDMYSRDACRLF